MKSKLLLNSKSVLINKLYTYFISNLLKIRKDSNILIQLCHTIVIYVVNLVYIAYIHNLIALVLQWAFTNYCNCVCANKILSIVYCLLSINLQKKILRNPVFKSTIVF